MKKEDKIITAACKACWAEEDSLIQEDPELFEAAVTITVRIVIGNIPPQGAKFASLLKFKRTLIINIPSTPGD